MSHPYPQVHRALRRARCRSILRLSDVLRGVVVFGRVLVLLAFHCFHACGVRVHRRLPGD